MDMERYGDYNEIDEPPRGKRNPVILIIKLLIALICISVVGILAFRMILFNYYPDSMKQIYFNDTLTEYYIAKDGNIAAETQNMRFPYDDPDEGNFFCDNLILVRDAGQLQVSVRYNTSVFDTIYKKYGVTLDPAADSFIFRLARDPRENPTTEDNAEHNDMTEVVAEPVGTLSVNNRESFMMYNYHKLVFDGIDFESDSEPKIEWLRLEVFIKGVDMEKPYKVLIYENNVAFSAFDSYNLSDSEVPSLD